VEINLDDELGLISEEAYCAFRGLSKESARNERTQGRAPPHVKLGNTIKYYRSGLRDLVKAKTVKPPSAPTLIDARLRGRRRQAAP